MTILYLTPALREKHLKLAAGSSCESCGTFVSHSELALHPIGEGGEIRDRVTFDLDDPEKILILCNYCHEQLHHADIPVELQRTAAKLRSDKVAEMMRSIVAGKEELCTPPDNTNLAEIFEDSVQPGSSNLFLNSS